MRMSIKHYQKQCFQNIFIMNLKKSWISILLNNFYPQLANSINEKHIDKLLDISDKAEDREFELKNKQENHRLIYVVLGIALFVFLTIFLAKDSQDIFLDVLKIGLGFLGGWGAGTYKKNK